MLILSETTDFETSGANLKPIFLKDLAHHVKETSIAVAPMQSMQPTRTQTPFTNIGNYLIQAACWLSCLADNQFQEVSTVRQDLAASFSSNVQKTWWLDHAASSDLSHQHKPSPTADVKKLLGNSVRQLGNSVRQLEIAIEKVTGTSPASIHLGTPTHKIDDFIIQVANGLFRYIDDLLAESCMEKIVESVLILQNRVFDLAPLTAMDVDATKLR